MLGALIGSKEYVEEETAKKVEKIREIISLLPLLEDPHTEFALLRNCLAYPKLSFLLRTVDTTPMSDKLQEFDRITREGLIRIIGCPVGEKAWHQAKLPVSAGGLGLRAAEDHAPAAYAASFLAARPLVSLLLGRGAEESAPPLPQTLLAALSTAIGEEARE